MSHLEDINLYRSIDVENTLLNDVISRVEKGNHDLLHNHKGASLVILVFSLQLHITTAYCNCILLLFNIC